ncbi:LacI family DNA-binding transcriptional regulator [Crateriforma conspicua]|uniref:Catabolite control protein A n=1 Tax=Crateriforma conspicua TaxID=2527996 RepID=A0A5C5Y1K5_9PLAN|nr:LacI family DNA-binding transcriptional regulator [Crateriforma conspicua]QDV63472.1 Catabolite control protein A [Crateriforma conspicua]TWT69020.1 Catabolite control protein A [Crateriforma conspicua]
MAGSRTGRVTLADVAAEVNVSVQLVSAVMNGRGPSTIGASDETRRRVREAAERLGYRRNADAASLRTARHGRVGVLMDRQDAGVFLPQNILAAMSDCFGKANLGLMIDSVLLSNAEARRKSRLMNEDCVDALVVGLSRAPEPTLVRALRSMDLPLLWLHRPLSKNSVSYDEAEAAAGLVEHLAQRGHRTIHFLDLNAPPDDAFAIRQRAEGFQRACEANSIHGVINFDHLVPRPQRASFARQWLDDHPQPTAVILGSCTAAQVFLDVALQIGREVPRSLAIATFDSGTMCTANAPSITAAILSQQAFGQAAGEMAVTLATKSAQSCRSRMIPCPVQVGGTTNQVSNEDL